MVILNSDLFHGTVHHPTKFPTDSWNPSRVWAVTPSLGPGPSLSWKISMECTKIGWAHPFSITICFMVLCITPPHFRPIAEILRVRVVTLLLRPALSLSWKISKFHAMQNNQLSMAIINSEMLHGTVHYPTKFQADSWNPWKVRVVTSFGTDGMTDWWQYPSATQRWGQPRVIIALYNLPISHWCCGTQASVVQGPDSI